MMMMLLSDKVTCVQVLYALLCVSFFSLAIPLLRVFIGERFYGNLCGFFLLTEDV